MKTFISLKFHSKVRAFMHEKRGLLAAQLKLTWNKNRLIPPSRSIKWYIYLLSLKDLDNHYYIIFTPYSKCSKFSLKTLPLYWVTCLLKWSILLPFLRTDFKKIWCNYKCGDRTFSTLFYLVEGIIYVGGLYGGGY